jgi:hypothetical protein
MTRPSVVICVPVHSVAFSAAEEMAVRRIAEVFNGHIIHFIAPHRLRLEIEGNQVDLLNAFPITYFADSHFESVLSYSRFLLQPDIYERFSDFDFLLICQTDVYVLYDDLSRWLSSNYDYIGAPLMRKDKKSDQLRAYAYNGGFSLRRISSFLRVINEMGFRYNRFKDLHHIEANLQKTLASYWRNGLWFNYPISPFNPKMNEDMIWSALIPRRFPFFNVAPLEMAVQFCQETHISALQLKFGQLPMAIHRWLDYEPDEAERLIKTVNPDYVTPEG